MPLTLPPVYPITDVLISGLSHAEQVEQLAAGGATLIQLREKHASPREFYEAALQAVKVARILGVRIIVNDRVDIALAIGADGVHVGQDDLPPARARELIGPDRILGYSTHSMIQALEAHAESADYIAVGPIFPTSTKANPDPAVGLALLRQLKAQLAKPLVAIGGLTLETATLAIEAGATSVAVISDLYATGCPAERIRDFLNRVSPK